MVSAKKIVLLVSFFLLLLSGCVEEYQPLSPDPEANRITGILITDSAGQVVSHQFQYDKLECRLYSMKVSRRESDSNNFQVINLELANLNYPEAYPDYIININRHCLDEEGWLNNEINSQITLNGDLRVEESETSTINGTTTTRRIEYLYDISGKLTESLHYYITPGSYENKRNVYEYQNSRIVEITTFDRNKQNEWAENRKTIFQYSADQLAEYIIKIMDHDMWTEKFRIVYSYNGSAVASVSTYEKVELDWVLMQTEGFEYDSKGYLVADSTQRGTYIHKRKMWYSKGSGNAEEVFVNPIDKLFRKPHVK